MTLPPLHPRCRCVIVYRESSRSTTSKPHGRGLAAGNSINLETGGKSPYLVSMINPKDTAQIKQALDWFEANAAAAPVENALIITTAGEIYHCTGKLNTLDSIVELGDKLRGATVTHNHPVGSVNEYSFSDLDWHLFTEFKLARLRGIDEQFVYELNRDPNFLDNAEVVVDKNNYKHWDNLRIAKNSGVGYRRWARERN